jgi:hypothetical protein
MTERSNLDFIVFAISQARQAEQFGFTRNECCRNLKTALHQYWQHKELQLHSTAHKSRIPRSRQASGLELSACQVEHAVPLMHIVNVLMNMPSLDPQLVEAVLRKFYVVRLVTAEEHGRLNGSGLRSVMPADWDETDVFARYKKAGIDVPEV